MNTNASLKNNTAYAKKKRFQVQAVRDRVGYNFQNGHVLKYKTTNTLKTA